MSLDIETLVLLDKKERMLSEIVVWLKAKGLWKECVNDLVTKVNIDKVNIDKVEDPEVRTPKDPLAEDDG